MKSTVTPGTTVNLVKEILEKESLTQWKEGFGLVMNPEFLREGSALSDFLAPDRIVLGGDKRAVDDLARLYEVFGKVDIVKTDATTAEMIKYCSNAFLATLISFSNEIANLSSRLNLDAIPVLGGCFLTAALV